MIKSKSIGGLLGGVASCVAAVYAFGIYNYSLNEPFWSFVPWQILGVISLFIVGSLIAYNSYKEDYRRVISLMNVYVVLISVYAIIWGFEVIEKQEVIFRLVHFRGQEAISYGKIAIGIGIFGIISTLLLPMNIKNKRLAAPDYLICVNCLESYASRQVKTRRCPKCDGLLEDLRGFYDRHPELRDRKQ